jgi:hypothetical protein
MLQQQHVDLLTLYQDFRGTMPTKVLEELRGRSFVAEFCPNKGWQIIHSDEDEEQLADWLQRSGIDWSRIVLDRIPGEAVVGGAQLL